MIACNTLAFYMFKRPGTGTCGIFFSTGSRSGLMVYAKRNSWIFNPKRNKKTLLFYNCAGRPLICVCRIRTEQKKMRFNYLKNLTIVLTNPYKTRKMII